MDKLQRDIDYFTHRLADVERLVPAAATAPARLAYAELARLYRERLTLLRGTHGDGGGLPSANQGHYHDGWQRYRGKHESDQSASSVE